MKITRLLKIPNNRRKLLIFIGDIILMAAVAAFLIFFHALATKYGILKTVRPLKQHLLYLAIPVNVFITYIFEQYDLQRRERIKTLASMLTLSVLSFCFMFAFAKVLRINQVTMVYIFVFLLITALSLSLWRFTCKRVLLASRHLLKQKVIFIGTDPITVDILDEMKHRDFKTLGILLEEDNDSADDTGLKMLGTWNQLGRIIHNEKPDILITASGAEFPLSAIKTVYKSKFSGCQVYDSEYFYELLAQRFAVKHYLENNRIPYLNIDIFARIHFRKLKTAMDFSAALTALVIASPVMLLIALLIKFTSRGPILFMQERVGFQEKPFKLMKFRTMIADAEKQNGPQWSSMNDCRITTIGKFLRKTRLDELPQLINICKGDMSFIGPRPIRKHFADIIEEQMPFYSLRFTVKPGLTGWAQVNYDYGGSVRGHIEKFQYDLYYLRHASIFLDLFIIIKTVQTVIRRPAY